MNLPAPTDYFSVFKPTTRGNWDFLTPIALLGLGLFGIAFIYSAQFSVQHGLGSGGLGYLVRQEWFKQILFLGLGGAVYVTVSLIDYRFWLSVAHWVYFACLVPLGLVLIPGVGGSAAEAWGASRWIPLGPLGTYQPSETAKIAVLLITASILVRSKIGTVSQSLGTLGKLALAVGVPMFLIWKQPDLKSVIVLPPMVFAMLYVSKLSTRFFLGALGAFLFLVGIVAIDTWRYAAFMREHHYEFNKENLGRYEPHSLLPLHDYQRNRILTFVSPETIDPLGTGASWNLLQSKLSVGSGGLTGKGWTEGTQAQLGYLPRLVAHNDFIFAVIAEEKGFLGSLTVLGLFGIVLFNGIRIAGSARDRFGTLLALGVTVLFLVHVFVNIAMTIGLVPITGIPLPFISYGGSFVLSCCLLQGLVQSVWRFRRDFA
ncbi:MAG TPA: FtsW/RodA/SpoVE family cell cycle protein [Opitutaceae bacterium]|nr:FtsW/RodA/SpoVE family cell cycle protein [Opitutaceae bacterium]